MNIYNLGNVVTVSAVWTKQSDGTAVDPDVVNLSLRAPDGTLTTYVYNTDAIIVNDGVGLYHANLDIEEVGFWYYRWWATGTGQAAQEGRFEVRDVEAV